MLSKHVCTFVYDFVVLQLMHHISYMGKHAYSHHAQMGRTFLSNQITLIDKFYDKVTVSFGVISLLTIRYNMNLSD
jgi:hypothetical protein